MPELAATQQLFGAALADAATAAGATGLFSGAPRRVLGRLAIYRANVAANAAKALAAAYPVMRQLVGDEFFDALARAYSNAHPSASGDLNEHGAQFALFLDSFEHTRELPYLPDVARLEWLVHRAHYAADHPALDLARLTRIPDHEYPGLALKLHSAAGLLRSPYPVGRIWEVHQPDYGGEITADLDSGAQCVLVHRPRYRVAVAMLDAGEAAFLYALAAGQRLGAALERAVAEEAAFDLAVSLQRWIAASLIVDMSVGDHAKRIGRAKRKPSLTARRATQALE